MWKTEIKVLDILELLEGVMGLSLDEWMSMTWEEEMKLVIGWCKENGYHYYGRPGHQFRRLEGIREAEELGAVGVVLENLS